MKTGDNMAIIDKQVYKLDNHNIEISDALFRCFKGEKYCRALINKLVFYDVDAITSKYSKFMSKKDDYDLSKLQTISFLGQNEKISRIIPIEKNWLAVFIKNTQTNDILQNKMMYLSLSGEGYISDDVQSALNGEVPKEVHMKYLEENLRGFSELDSKYFDGNHDEFLAEIFAKARAMFTNYFVSIIQSENSGILNQDLKQRNDITLEELREIIDTEFRRKPRAEDFPIYDAMDLVYHSLGCDKVVEFSNRYKLVETQNKIIYQEKS